MAEPVYANEDPVRVVPVEGAKFFANKHPWRVVGDFDSLVEIHDFPTGDDIKTKKFYHLLDEVEHEGEIFIPGIYYYDKPTEEWRMLDESGFSVIDDFHSNPDEASRRRAVSERAISWARTYRGDISSTADIPEDVKMYHIFRADNDIHETEITSLAGLIWVGNPELRAEDDKEYHVDYKQMVDGEEQYYTYDIFNFSANDMSGFVHVLDGRLKGSSSWNQFYTEVSGGWQGNYGTFKFTGGDDIANPELITWLQENGTLINAPNFVVAEGDCVVALKDEPYPRIDNENWKILYTGIINDVDSDHLAASTLVSPSEAAVSWARCYRGNITAIEDLPENIKKYHIFRADNEIDFPNTITDIAGLTWVGNDTLTFLTPDPDQIAEYDITTQFGNTLWFNRTTHELRSGWVILYHGDDHWYFEERRRLTFGTGSDSTNPKLINWLKNNGTFVDAEGVTVPEGALIVAEKDNPAPLIDGINWTLLYTGAAIDDVNSNPDEASDTLPSTERAISWARSYRGNFESLITLVDTVEDIKKYHIFRAEEDIDEKILYDTVWNPKEGEVLRFPETSQTFNLDFSYYTSGYREFPCSKLTINAGKNIVVYNTEYSTYDTLYRDGEWLDASGRLYFKGTGEDSANTTLIEWLNQGVFSGLKEIKLEKGDCVVAEKDKPAPIVDGTNWTLLSTGEKENCYRGLVYYINDLPTNAEKGVIYGFRRDNSYDDYRGATWKANESNLEEMTERTYYVNFSIPGSYDDCYHIRFENSTVPGVTGQNIYYYIHESDGDWEAKVYDAETGWSIWPEVSESPYRTIVIKDSSINPELRDWFLNPINGEMEGAKHIILPAGSSVASLVDNPERKVDGENWIALHTEAPTDDVNSNVSLASKDLAPTEAAVSWARCYKGNISSMEDLPKGIKKDHIFRFTKDASVTNDVTNLAGLTWRGNEIVPNDMFWEGRSEGGRFYIENDVGSLSYLFEGSASTGGMNRIRFYTDTSGSTVWNKPAGSPIGFWYLRTWKITGGSDAKDPVLIKWMKENGVFSDVPTTNVPAGACIVALKDDPEPFIDDINWTILYTGGANALVLPYQDAYDNPYTLEESRMIYEHPENVVIIIPDPEDPEFQQIAFYSYGFEEDGIRLYFTQGFDGERYGALFQIEKDGDSYEHVSSILDVEPLVIDDVNSNWLAASTTMASSERAISWARCYKGDITSRFDIPDELMKGGHILRMANDVEFVNYGNSNYTFNFIYDHDPAEYELAFSYDGHNCTGLTIVESSDPMVAGQELWYTLSSGDSILVYDAVHWIVPEAKEIKFKAATRAFPAELEEWLINSGTFTNTSSTVVKAGNCIVAQTDSPKALIDNSNWVVLHTARTVVLDDINSDVYDASGEAVPSEKAASWARCYRGDITYWKDAYLCPDGCKIKKGHIFRAANDIDEEVLYDTEWTKNSGEISFEGFTTTKQFDCFFDTTNAGGSTVTYSNIEIIPGTRKIRALNEASGVTDIVYEDGDWKIGSSFHFHDVYPGPSAGDPEFIAWLKENGELENLKRLTIKEGECIAAQCDNPAPEISDVSWVILHTEEGEKGLIVLPYKDGVHEAYTEEEAKLLLEKPESIIILTNPDDTKGKSLASYFTHINGPSAIGGAVYYETPTMDNRKYLIAVRIDKTGDVHTHVVSNISEIDDRCYRGNIESLSDLPADIRKGDIYRADADIMKPVYAGSTFTFNDVLTPLAEEDCHDYNIDFTLTSSGTVCDRLGFTVSRSGLFAMDYRFSGTTSVYREGEGFLSPDYKTITFGEDTEIPAELLTYLKNNGTFTDIDEELFAPEGTCIVAEKDNPETEIDNINWTLLYTNEKEEEACYKGSISSIDDLPAENKKGDIYRASTDIMKPDYAGSTLNFNDTLSDHADGTYDVSFSGEYSAGLYRDYISIRFSHADDGTFYITYFTPTSSYTTYVGSTFVSSYYKTLYFAEDEEIPEELLEWFKNNGIFTNVGEKLVIPEGACIVAEKDNPKAEIDNVNWTLLYTNEKTCYKGNIASMEDLPDYIRKGDIYRADADIKKVISYGGSTLNFNSTLTDHINKAYELSFEYGTSTKTNCQGIQFTRDADGSTIMMYKIGSSWLIVYRYGTFNFESQRHITFSSDVEIPADLLEWFKENGVFVDTKEEIIAPEGACIVAEKDNPEPFIDGDNWTLLHTEENILYYRGNVDSLEAIPSDVKKYNIFRLTQDATAAESLSGRTMVFEDNIGAALHAGVNAGRYINYYLTDEPETTYSYIAFDKYNERVAYGTDPYNSTRYYDASEGGWVDPKYKKITFVDGPDITDSTTINLLKTLGVLNGEVITTVPAGTCIVAEKDNPEPIIDGINWTILYTNKTEERGACYHGNISSLDSLPDDVKRGDIYRASADIRKTDYEGASYTFSLLTPLTHEDGYYPLSFNCRLPGGIKYYEGIEFDHASSDIRILYRLVSSGGPAISEVAYADGAWADTRMNTLFFNENTEIPADFETWMKAHGYFMNTEELLLIPEGACIVAEKDAPEKKIDNVNWTLLHTEDHGITVLPYKDASDRYTSQEVERIVEKPESVVIKTKDTVTILPFSAYFANSYTDEETGFDTYRFITGITDEIIGPLQMIEILIDIRDGVHQRTRYNSTGVFVFEDAEQTLTSKEINVRDNIISAETGDYGKILAFNDEGIATPENLLIRISLGSAISGTLSPTQIYSIESQVDRVVLDCGGLTHKCVSGDYPYFKFQALSEDRSSWIDVNIDTGEWTRNETSLQDSIVSITPSGRFTEEQRQRLKNYPLETVITFTDGLVYRYYQGSDTSGVYVSIQDNSLKTLTVNYTSGSYATGSIALLREPSLTPARALVSNASGNIAASSISSTELNCLYNVTSNIQEQLNDKEKKIEYVTVTAQSGTLTASQLAKLKENELNGLIYNNYYHDPYYGLLDATTRFYSYLAGGWEYRFRVDMSTGVYTRVAEPASIVTGVKGEGEPTYRTGNVNITKAQIGLGSVDDTSDATKKANFTGEVASGNTGFVTGDMVYQEVIKSIISSITEDPETGVITIVTK